MVLTVPKIVPRVSARRDVNGNQQREASTARVSSGRGGAEHAASLNEPGLMRQRRGVYRYQTACKRDSGFRTFLN